MQMGSPALLEEAFKHGFSSKCFFSINKKLYLRPPFEPRKNLLQRLQNLYYKISIVSKILALTQLW